MGAEPWYCFAPYCADINTALQNLREREFRAGRYGQQIDDEEFRAFWNLDDELKQSAEDLIKAHGSVEAAIEAVFVESEPDGTASILDMFRVSDVPEPCAVSPVEDLQDLIGTAQPTRQMVESMLIGEEDPNASEEFWNSIGRGEGRYIILFDNGNPVEIFFAGYSFD